ncbi:MAG: DUF2442 domain-containing protein [Chlorobiales bacterium]|nr:DUF2442 domain-containing protein [Chlorobiales bacterium]
MNTAVTIEPRIISVEITDDSITAFLEDGRTISVPLAWSWRLSEASIEQRNNFEIIGNGIGIHWQDIDEDISAEGMLYGIPAQKTGSKKSA